MLLLKYYICFVTKLWANLILVALSYATARLGGIGGVSVCLSVTHWY